MLESIIILGFALVMLIKGSDFFVEGAKEIGASFGLSKFVIGVFIIGIGTSLPELASSVAAALHGTTEIVVANAVGSNITNILLIIGLLAAVGGRINIQKNLLLTELPLFFIASVFFIFVVMDGYVDRMEALLLISTFAVYVWYLFGHTEDGGTDVIHEGKRKKIHIKSFIYIFGGMAAVLIGAHYTVEATISLATLFKVPVGLVSIAAIAIGTSLPELFVSLRALQHGDAELAIGNIFGSNTFNILIAVGVPALITPLTVDVVVMNFGIYVFIAASLILFVYGLSRQIMRWEGVMTLLFFAFFLIKLADFI